MIRFIHIPKNAGTTVGKMLGRNQIEFVIGDREQHTRHRYARDFRDSFDSFAVVRNPYTRTVSWFEWIRRYPKYSKWQFDEFVKEARDKGRARHAWTPQIHWTHDFDLQTPLVKHILRYENLEEDLRTLFPSMSGKFLHLNGGGIKRYNDYYNDELRSIVYSRFKEDFDTFKYDK